MEGGALARREGSPCSATMQAASPLRLGGSWYAGMEIFCSSLQVEDAVVEVVGAIINVSCYKKFL